MAQAIRAGDLTSSVAARWGGKPIDTWTRQRAENVRAKSRFVADAKRKAVPSVYDCFLGPRFAKLVDEGALYPYPLEARKRTGPAPELPAGASWTLTARHRDALAFVVTAHLACGTRGLIISHETMSGLLACSARTAGTVMRQLVAWNLLATQPWFSSETGPSLRLSNRYTVTPFAVFFFGLERLGKNCQAERTPPSGDANEVSAVADGPFGPAPDATPEDSAARVKARPDPEASTKPGRANGRLVRVRSALADDVARLTERAVDREAAPIRLLAARLARVEDQQRARAAELDRRELELATAAGNTHSAAEPYDPLAELRRSVSGVDGKGGSRR